MPINIVALISFFVAVVLAGGLGSRFAPGAWYFALAKPSSNPPGWLFGPVWTLLYVCIAIAGYRVWKVRREDMAVRRKQSLVLWALQLALNSAWSWLFFGVKAPGVAFGEISLMLLTIGAFIVVAHKLDRVASRLSMPYAGWVSFATVLNFTLWRMNPGV
jgi:translocator protein